MRCVLIVFILFFAPLSVAGIVQFKDGNGAIYQVDSNVKIESRGVSSRLRWPSNEQDRILVSGCKEGGGTLWVDVKGKWANPVQWTLGGGRVVDQIARAVCESI